MEWNWFGNGNNPNLLLLSESTGDSEDVKSDVYHDHEEVKAPMDEQEGVLFRLNDEDDVDDDAQSCSYDHSSYNNTRHGNSRHRDEDDDEDDGDGDGDDGGEVEDDDDKNKNWCETKVMDSSKQQWRPHKSCVDPSKQREIDRKFWETCLAS